MGRVGVWIGSHTRLHAHKRTPDEHGRAIQKASDYVTPKKNKISPVPTDIRVHVFSQSRPRLRRIREWKRPGKKRGFFASISEVAGANAVHGVRSWKVDGLQAAIVKGVVWC